MSLKSNVKRLIIYAFFGVITTAINWAVYILLQKLNFGITLSNALAWIASVMVAFSTSKIYTFKNKARSFKELLEQLILFIFARLLSGLLQIFFPTLLLSIGLTHTLFGIRGFWAKIITNGIVILFNYTLSRTLVFPQKNLLNCIKNKLKNLSICSKIKSRKRNERSTKMLSNYHTHTVRCNHAIGLEEEYIKRAISAGMTDLGFADHIPYLFPNETHVDGAKMDMSLAEDYFSTLLDLREKYFDKIKIHIGFEAEYYESCFDKTLNKLMEYPLDYLILGQHRVGDYRSPIVFKPTQNEQDLKSYVDTVIKAINTDKFSCIAHPDVINYTGDEEIYVKHMRRLCAAALEFNVPLEINMLGAATNRHYPNERFFKLVAETGNKVIIGCDAHSPDMIINTTGFERCREILNKYGITPLNYLVLKKLR